MVAGEDDGTEEGGGGSFVEARVLASAADGTYSIGPLPDGLACFQMSR